MRDFFVHKTPERESQYINCALSYFREHFPDAENSVKCYNGLIIAYSNDPSFDKINSPLWCEGRGAFLFIFGEYSFPDVLKSPRFNRTNYSETTIGLFEEHGDSLFEKISGNFNALIYYPNEKRLIVITSKLGLYPIYYHKHEKDFLVSSRLGIFKNISGAGKPDYAVIMQHCLYNYPISSKTFLKDVSLQPAGSVLSYFNRKLSITRYWLISEEIIDSQKKVTFNNSVDFLDEVLDRIMRNLCKGINKTALSLTGGWDGRLLLAYALKYLSRDQLLLYSHGTMQSPDVILPLSISKKLKLKYIPVLLNYPQYLKEQMRWAVDTVKYSDGIRQVSRLHYLYNMSILRKEFGIENIISGNGGSNLLKSINYKPCHVFNRFVIEIIESDDFINTLHNHYDYCLSNFPSFFQNVGRDLFVESFEQDFFNSFFSIENKYQRFLHFLISEIERKYFGSEIQSYKHLVKNYSPFFDDEFIKALVRTTFIESDHMKGILKSYKISILYAKLIVRNNRDLAEEPTDRGFSMNDLSSPLNFPIMIFKYFKTKSRRTKHPDYFCNKHIPRYYTQKFFSGQKPFGWEDLSNKSFVENYISVISFLKE